MPIPPLDKPLFPVAENYPNESPVRSINELAASTCNPRTMPETDADAVPECGVTRSLESPFLASYQDEDFRAL